MNKKIQSALISVFYKDGVDVLAKTLLSFGVKIYSTGGTQKFLEDAGIECIAVESVTSYPSILGGRVKTLHPKVFGGILGRRSNEQDLEEMAAHEIPELDLVIVDLYPFEETLATTDEEAKIIEKVDIGGPSMLRAAAKNFKDVCVLGSKDDYEVLGEILKAQNGETTIEQRKSFAARTFKIVTDYDIAISDYFNSETRSLRYGENPHQEAQFIGNLSEQFEQLNGKGLSYNNLVDVDAAVGLLNEFAEEQNPFFAVFKHTNVCGAAIREDNYEAWKAALAGDPESAFGGVIVTNQEIIKEVAEDMSGIFFEVLIAPSFNAEAVEILSKKKNRILLVQKDVSLSPELTEGSKTLQSSKTILAGRLIQNVDDGNYTKWEEVGARESNAEEKANLSFANLMCKHLKSNAIALVKNNQLIGKGCGQTSRIDALRHSITKAEQFDFDLNGAVLASDAFFPFDDCVKIAKEVGINACIQPGGSMRDGDSVDFAKANDMVMVMTGMRHFKH